MPRWPDPRDRLLAAVVIDPVTGCWEWQRYRTPKGYGRMRLGGECQAHRVAYILFVGPIPEGKQIDHLCRNRGCVNPRHLEAVTPRENTMRSPNVAIAAVNARKTHCVNGHPFAGSNLYRHPDGRRVCRRCVADAQARSRDGRLVAS